MEAMVRLESVVRALAEVGRGQPQSLPVPRTEAMLVQQDLGRSQDAMFGLFFE